MTAAESSAREASWKGVVADPPTGRQHEIPTSARGQLLLPWPNRLHTGRYSWDGASYQVPLNEPEQQNAIHGPTRWHSWAGEQHSPPRSRCGCCSPPTTGISLTLGLEATYRVGADVLRLRPGQRFQASWGISPQR
jgi:aldose 1-epimerase